MAQAMKRWMLLVFLAAVALVSGCASVPMASGEADAAAKNFAAKPGKANIYVYRNETFGGAIRMPITHNGRMVGQSGPKTFFLIEVDPGSHEISSVTENTSTVKVDVAAGRNYFVWQEVKMGMWAARSKLQIVDEAVGRAGVMECKRAM